MDADQAYAERLATIDAKINDTRKRIAEQELRLAQFEGVDPKLLKDVLQNTNVNLKALEYLRDLMVRTPDDAVYIDSWQ